MSAPKKPNYARLRVLIPEVAWAVMGREQRFTELLDRTEWLEGERERHRLALRHITDVIGTGNCSVNGCEGCRYEAQEAMATARTALRPASFQDSAPGTSTSPTQERGDVVEGNDTGSGAE